MRTKKSRRLNRKSCLARPSPLVVVNSHVSQVGTEGDEEVARRMQEEEDVRGEAGGMVCTGEGEEWEEVKGKKRRVKA